MRMDDGAPWPLNDAMHIPQVIRAHQFVWRDPQTFPRRRWLYGHHLVRKFISCTFAQGGVGKSSLALVEAVAMATDRRLLGQPIHEGPLRVWYWNGEDPLEEIERRVAAICLHFNIEPDALGDRLYLNSGRDCGIVLAATSRNGTAVARSVVDAMTATIAEQRIDVVILDPFVSTHTVAENDNGAVATVCKALAGIADETECAIELVHHVRKTGGADVTVEDGRGAVALLAAARSARVLNAMSTDQADQAGVSPARSFFRVDNGKANLAAPPDKSDWHRLVAVPLGNGDDPCDDGDRVAVVTPWTWPDPLADVTVEHLRSVQVAVAAGRWRENHQAKDWVGKAVGAALSLDPDDKADRAKIVRLIRIWLKSGALITVEGEDEKRNKRTFVEVGRPAD